MMPTSERIDRRYSDEKAEPVPWVDSEARLAAAEVAWVVTVRPDGGRSPRDADGPGGP